MLGDTHVSPGNVYADRTLGHPISTHAHASWGYSDPWTADTDRAHAHTRCAYYYARPTHAHTFCSYGHACRAQPYAGRVHGHAGRANGHTYWGDAHARAHTYCCATHSDLDPGSSDTHAHTRASDTHA